MVGILVEIKQRRCVKYLTGISLGGKQVGWLLACWSQSNGTSMKVNLTMTASKLGCTYRRFSVPRRLACSYEEKNGLYVRFGILSICLTLSCDYLLFYIIDLKVKCGL